MSKIYGADAPLFWIALFRFPAERGVQYALRALYIDTPFLYQLFYVFQSIDVALGIKPVLPEARGLDQTFSFPDAQRRRADLDELGRNADGVDRLSISFYSHEF